MNSVPVSIPEASAAQRAIDHSIFNDSSVSWPAILAGAGVVIDLADFGRGLGFIGFIAVDAKWHERSNFGCLNHFMAGINSVDGGRFRRVFDWTP